MDCGLIGKDRAYWLADQIGAHGDYAKEAALVLCRQADEIERLRNRPNATFRQGGMMKLETMKSNSKEIFLDAGDMSVTINTWANLEGASLMVHGKGPELPLRMAGSFRWEELDALMVALAAARAA